MEVNYLMRQNFGDRAAPFAASAASHKPKRNYAFSFWMLAPEGCRIRLWFLNEVRQEVREMVVLLGLLLPKFRRVFVMLLLVLVHRCKRGGAD